MNSTVYRTIELINGFTGIIIRTQIYFNLGDGLMILLATYCLNFLHPGYLLKDIIEEERRLKQEVKNMEKSGSKGGRVPVKLDQMEQQLSYEAEPYEPYKPYESWGEHSRSESTSNLQT